MTRGQKPRLMLLAVLCGTRASTCNPLTAVHLPDCAHAYLRQGADQVELLPPNGSSSYPPMNVGRAYLIHYTKNRGRMEFQRMQLPQLGVPVSVVRSFDAEKIDEGVMRCVVPATPRAIPGHPWKLTQYFYDAHGDRSSNVSNVAGTLHRRGLSATLKLFVALYDMTVVRNLEAALVFEDDVRVRWEYSHFVNRALRELKADFTVLYACSFSENGWDLLPLPKEADRYHLYEKGATIREVGLMAACGEVVSAQGARHILNSFPIVMRIDHMLSDSYLESGRQPRQFYIKRYPFVAAMWNVEKTETVGHAVGPDGG